MSERPKLSPGCYPHGWEVGRGTGAYDKISGEPYYVCDVRPADDPADAILAALEGEGE